MTSDSTGWAGAVNAGSARLLVTWGAQRTKNWPDVPILKEVGIDLISNSPFGIGGPKGMDPAVVKILHDAFKKTIDDPEHAKMLQQLDQVYWYCSSEDYAKWARETWEQEKSTVERLGLQVKP